jgi:hypothetical protein
MPSSVYDQDEQIVDIEVRITRVHQDGSNLAIFMASHGSILHGHGSQSIAMG